MIFIFYSFVTMRVNLFKILIVEGREPGKKVRGLTFASMYTPIANQLFLRHLSSVFVCHQGFNYILCFIIVLSTNCREEVRCEILKNNSVSICLLTM